MSGLGDDRHGVASTGELIECAELADPVRQREIEQRIVPGDDSHRTRIRRSWVWVDYAGILMSRVAERWLLDDTASDVSAANTAVELGPEGFEEFFLHEDREVDPERPFVSAIDEHLAPVLRIASVSSKVGLRNLWGSVASSIVRATSAACRRRGADLPMAGLQAFLDARPELAGKGTIVRPRTPAHPAIVGLHRATCCLWFRVDPGQLCGDCVLSSRDRVLAELERLAVEESA